MVTTPHFSMMSGTTHPTKKGATFWKRGHTRNLTVSY